MGFGRVACDSLVALPNSTSDGVALFAKNSDRPANESQPLVQFAQQRHDRGSRLRCQYVEIEQASETARVIGSQPFWLWGFEHGLNEHGVAIGNHTVFARDELSGEGLIGMDLVRLGLERGRTAQDAVTEITSLIERYGQGGSGYFDKNWPYHNSFLVADAREAYVLESSDKVWAVRRVQDVASVSNHISIGDDWDALSQGAIEHACDRGWWNEEVDARFDFAAAYRDDSLVPPIVSSGRHRRTCALLEFDKQRLTPAALRLALRDHYDGPIYRPTHSADDEHYYSVCMHADPVGTTTASMIARLPADENDVSTYWASLGSPCLGVFLPMYVQADLPRELAIGGAEASADSPWWRFKELLLRVESAWSLAERVRQSFDEFEETLERERLDVEAQARDLIRAEKRAAALSVLTAFSKRVTATALLKLEELLDQLRR